ncbi:MAG TPA: amidase [Ktedonobacteraceae bacterium]|nr:amidase [Ktedonobacteraceae bacterium]
MNEAHGEAFIQLEEATIAQLQAAMNAGQFTAERLVELYLERIEAIDRHGPTLKSIIEINPECLEIAGALDGERAAGRSRGPLHGIPILIKDNIATADSMQTTAGSLALVGSKAPRDAFVARKLREAGAVILGKTNLSEWANFRSNASSSGWSGRGGQTRNPYVLDRTPCGSSSGSGAAIAANLAAAALGTETDGSILCPSAINSLVGIKPTVGLTSRAGVVPIAHSQDTVGPMARTVTDAAILLGAITGIDEHDPATQSSASQYFTDYTKYLDANGLRGARIGIARQVYFGYSAKADAIIETAIERMRALGAEIIDNADIPTAHEMADSEAEMTVLLHEFKADLNAYLNGLIDSPVRTLAEIITFNNNHPNQELPYFGQEVMLKAQATTSLDDTAYRDALAENRRLARQEGIDAVMDAHQLDALVMPTTSPAWCIDLVNGDHHSGSSAQPAALAGYPVITVPAGYAFELPVGISFMGRAYSEPTLLKLAYAFEQCTKIRRAPRYLATIEI